MVYLYFILLFLILVFTIISIIQLRKPGTIPVNLELKEKYTHISHRGASGEAPENTLLAFRIAVEKYNTDVLEMDVHSTNDKVIVVIHDRTLHRTTNGKGNIKDYTYEELEKFDAGYWYKTEGKNEFPYRGKGIKIPTLKEVFEIFPNLKFNIEVKQKNPPIEEDVINLIREAGFKDKVILGSSKISVSKKLKKLAPEIASFCNKWNVIIFYILNKTSLGFLYRPKHQALQPTAKIKPVNIVQPSIVNAVHKKGMLFHVWTINDEKDMEKFVNMGVDGIMTDYPERLNNVLKRLNKK